MSLVDKLIDLVEKTAEAVVPAAPAMLEAARALYALVESIAPTLSEQDQDRLQQALPPLLSKMNRNVDQAIADLRGAKGG